MSRDNLTPSENAAVNLLEEIATDANSLRHAFLDMEHDGVQLRGSSLAVFRTFAEKIGWMAELGVNRLTGFNPIKGDAIDWLLSPLGADAVRATADPDSKVEAPAPKPKNPMGELIDKLMALDEAGRQKLLDTLKAGANQKEQADPGVQTQAERV